MKKINLKMAFLAACLTGGPALADIVPTVPLRCSFAAKVPFQTGSFEAQIKADGSKSKEVRLQVLDYSDFKNNGLLVSDGVPDSSGAASVETKLEGTDIIVGLRNATNFANISIPVEQIQKAVKGQGTKIRADLISKSEVFENLTVANCEVPEILVTSADGMSNSIVNTFMDELKSEPTGPGSKEVSLDSLLVTCVHYGEHFFKGHLYPERKICSFDLRALRHYDDFSKDDNYSLSLNIGGADAKQLRTAIRKKSVTIPLVSQGKGNSEIPRSELKINCKTQSECQLTVK